MNTGGITTTTIIIITSWCPRGVGKDRFQQSDHDTLRDGRKGDPQHKCCGKKYVFTDFAKIYGNHENDELFYKKNEVPICSTKY